jgi:hypothetical protein
MADPVRPPQWPVVQRQPTAPARTDAKTAAQKAFFEAALGGKIGVQVLATEEVQSSPRTQRAFAPTQPKAGDGILPPGSLINILV